MKVTEASTTLPEPATLPVLDERHTYATLTDRIVGIPLSRFSPRFLALLALCFLMTGVMTVSISMVIARGVGIWGVDIPVAWGFAIINFVWWIGIGHAGTLISAILLLLRQPWRNSINRFAEAMTIFAVANAGLFPLLHLGRIWRFYYLFPYPNTMDIWPQWRSPLVWDVFAVLTYFTVSLLFWYVGLIPDLASLRDAAHSRAAKFWAGIFALGWRNSARHWQRHQTLYLILAGLSTPLVVSVHSIVSMDFATGLVPGWHTSIFPPYFVAGAIFSGFAMVLTLALPLRAAFKLHDIITPHHLNSMSKVMLVTGLIVAYGYLFEGFTEWFSSQPAEQHRLWLRIGGSYSPGFWLLILCNVIIPQALWSRRVRTSPSPLFVVSIIINIGMWLERFDIVVTSLHQDFMASAWGRYVPTIWDISLFLGTIGFFVFMFLLFIRFVPMAPIYELREFVHNHDHSSQDESASTTTATTAKAAPAAPLYALCAQFTKSDQLTRAASQARARGYTLFDAYSPVPLQPLFAAMGLRRAPLPFIMLLGALAGGLTAFLTMRYASVTDYPWIVGGKPFYSWPSWIPITFELSVLGASLFGVLGMLALNGLPQPYHPVFNDPLFDRASRDRFFLCIEAADPMFDPRATRDLLAQFAPVTITEVAQ
jgi:Ni/Fe-hydrogenase subunit HybB-like protein